MPDAEPVLPACGHVDRIRELTQIEIGLLTGQTLMLLVCTVPGCPEYCRVFADLRDDAGPEDEAGAGGLPPMGPECGWSEGAAESAGI